MLLNSWSGLNSWFTANYKTIPDAVKAATGLSIEEGLALHFGKTAGEHIQDAERRWLIAQGATAAHLQDMWIELHGPGDIADVQLAYWNTQAP